MNTSSIRVTVEQENIQIDLQLLFKRLRTVARTEDDMMQAFHHELCSLPPALFEKSGLLRPANKLVLAGAIWKALDREAQFLENVGFVLEGGHCSRECHG